MSQQTGLKGKVTVVTGASRGIGRGLALAFAREGAIVVAAARTLRASSNPVEGSLEETVGQITKARGKAIAIACDVSVEDEVKTLVARVLREIGPIDVLVNNAGISVSGPIEGLAAEDFDRVLAVNVRGPFLTCKYVLPGMMERRQGSVINVSSRTADRDEAESLVYGPSKAALDRFTLNLAAAMRPYNIAVNGLRPGLIASGMTIGFTPLRIAGRTLGAPETVVPPALWLAQQDASTFTGRIVHRDDFGKSWP